MLVPEKQRGTETGSGKPLTQASPEPVASCKTAPGPIRSIQIRVKLDAQSKYGHSEITGAQNKRPNILRDRGWVKLHLNAIV
jgi:hypothetical protein